MIIQSHVQGQEEKTEEEQPHACRGRKTWGWELQRCGRGQGDGEGWGEVVSPARDSEWAHGSSDRRLGHTGGQARSWKALNVMPGSAICSPV